MSTACSPPVGARTGATCPVGRARASLAAFVRGPWFAYGMLILLQLHVVWGMWRWRDLSSGDTSFYFVRAFGWFDTGRVDICWSPLYTIFYGSLNFLTRDPYRVTILHRLVIVLAASLLVLAVFRRLLPPALAWFAAAWWAVLPINFDTVYEVHLFAVLPSLAACLLLLSSPGRWARGAALAVFCASAVLVRNEMVVAAALFAVACVIWEWRARQAARVTPGTWPGQAPVGWRGLALTYGAPLAAVAGLCLFLYGHTAGNLRDHRADLEWKHTVNMAQVFTFGYKQRHAECSCDPWSGYEEVMTTHFGEPTPSLWTMLRRNPRAVLAHFWWNWRLAPNGLQVLLFNRMSGSVNPDYVPVNSGSLTAAFVGVVVLACWVVGLVCLVRQRHYWWETWVRPRLWGWVGMLAVAVVAIPVISTQRPRPSYLFGLSVFLIAATGMSLWVILHRRRWPQGLAPLAMVAVTIAVPPYYHRAAAAGSSAGIQRLLHDLTRRLLPYETIQPPAGSVALTGDFHPFQVAAYVWKGRCAGLGYGMLDHDWPDGMPLEQFLDRHQVAVLYVNDRMLRQLESLRAKDAQAFLTGPLPPGWRKLGSGDEPGDRWQLFMLIPRPPSGYKARS